MTGHTNHAPTTPPLAVVEAAVELLSEAGGTARLTVSGYSMAPLLRPGDVVVVRLGQVRPRLGDLVVRRQSDALVVHRVIKLAGRQVITKGDATIFPDPPATPAELLGVVTSIEGTSTLDLTRGAWRMLNPALALYSGFVSRAWVVLLALRRKALPGRLPAPLQLAGRLVRFALRAPLHVVAHTVRRF